MDFLALQGALQDATASDQIDLIDLNSASPTLRFEAISGTLLLKRDDQEMAEFVSVTSREYESAFQILTNWPKIEPISGCLNPSPHPPHGPA